MFELIDLTKKLDMDLSIYAEDGYADPPLQIENWCDIQRQGYKVSRLSLGTQTGTHIDAPSHFAENGATLDALPLPSLMGKYFWVDLDAIFPHEKINTDYQGESILFLASAGKPESEISQQLFDALLDLPCLVWVIPHDIHVTGRALFYFNQRLAEAGKFLIENVDETSAAQVKAGGELIALPLRLIGVSGSPCRVVVRQGVAEN
jgi:kynurenine formamidase